MSSNVSGGEGYGAMGTLVFDWQTGGELPSISLRPKLSASGHTILIGIIAVLSLWIRSGNPLTAIGISVADDALFIQLAHDLAAGHWLGPFYNMTLVKGPTYPIFIALSFWAGIPLKIAETIVYLAVAYLTAVCVRRLSGSLVLSTILFAALALNPGLWTGSLARVIRKGLYVSLSLAVIVATLWLGIFFFAERRPRTLTKAMLCGLVWAAFWLTREEGTWIVPSVTILIAGSLARSAALSRRDRKAAPPIAALTVRYGTALLAMLVLVSTVAIVNKVRYGHYETVEVKSAPFRRAYGALSRVKPDHWRRYVVFSERCARAGLCRQHSRPGVEPYL